jgi:hypothetical protein
MPPDFGTRLPEGEHPLVPAAARHLNTESMTFSGFNRFAAATESGHKGGDKKSGINFMRGMKPQ